MSVCSCWDDSFAFSFCIFGALRPAIMASSFLWPVSLAFFSMIVSAPTHLFFLRGYTQRNTIFPFKVNSRYFHQEVRPLHTGQLLATEVDLLNIILTMRSSETSTYSQHHTIPTRSSCEFATSGYVDSSHRQIALTVNLWPYLSDGISCAIPIHTHNAIHNACHT